jgi:adenine-specific DNA-methyltransferase
VKRAGCSGASRASRRRRRCCRTRNGLIARRIRPFDESNWWQWGRGYHQSQQPRVYVNNKTRRLQPFFVHPCTNYDGSVLAIFPHDPAVDVQALAAALNAVDWADLGFVCDGRFLFAQRSLEQTPLPESFRAFAPGRGVKIAN